METITILNNQSVLDIAIQHTGDIIDVVKIAVQNNISLTDKLLPGIDLNIPDDVGIDQNVKDYITGKKIQPASELLAEMIIVNPLEGVGYWEIENEFEIE